MIDRLLLSVLLACSLPAWADGYPVKPIRLVIPYAPGGTTDTLARIVGKGLLARWGQPVIPDNRSGAAGNIGAEAVAKAPADGYTLMLSAAGPLAVNKGLYKSLPYDPDAFVPVSIIARSHSLLVVHPDKGRNSLAELIAEARARPDKLTYASSGIGSTPHLAAELFKSMSGTHIVHVPYRGVAPALTDLVAGHVDMMFVEMGAALPYVRSGQLRALALGSDTRKPALPDVPTVAETLPGFLSVTWFGLAAPPGTPPAVAGRLALATDELLREPEVRRQIESLNIEAVGGTPAQAVSFIRQESSRWLNVLAQAGIHAQE
ncbi:tripartite tricarboxylate transporter substrate binding protein [Pigmentiphaga sp. H8]|uniref:Bug family tripartite tricarboxylate transporter substrate binding protein n=1 Tax=Pigmentiphaga sp. H8 TaxID=2488560 RepID=UPI000F592132|nr:tripartite tricarboxylate transporter substrate binding protein [Pigmentiphaga sp. H8]AZG09751.1 tripartite tricarboxylate transporter substrate binding protein [Pigmentiphaga sp. H8]